ncbi:MAG: hypothetical protein WA324_18195 [Bryobacteraceae bacterium]
MSFMTAVPVPDIPRLHTTPLASIRVQGSRVIAAVDDEREKRFNLVFVPYQAVRITTSDCYIPPGEVKILRGTVLEVLQSDWIDELTTNLSKVDESATFMNEARHFVVPLQDAFLEVVAWNITTSAADEGSH